MQRVRYIIGRWLIHTGIRVMPWGRVRNELMALVQQWSDGVRATVRAQP